MVKYLFLVLSVGCIFLTASHVSQDQYGWAALMLVCSFINVNTFNRIGEIQKVQREKNNED